MCKTDHASFCLLIMSELLLSLPAYSFLLIQHHPNSWQIYKMILCRHTTKTQSERVWYKWQAAHSIYCKRHYRWITYTNVLKLHSAVPTDLSDRVDITDTKRPSQIKKRSTSVGVHASWEAKVQFLFHGTELWRGEEGKAPHLGRVRRWVVRFMSLGKETPVPNGQEVCIPQR